MGTINNLIHVKKSDFEVFDALKVDSLESSETSYRGDFSSTFSMNIKNDELVSLLTLFNFQ